MARDRRPQLRDLDVEIPDGVLSGGSKGPSTSAAGSPPGDGDSFQLRADCEPFRAVPMRAGEDAREGDSVQRSAAHPQERWAIRIARLGRKLPGERGVGGAFGFANQSESQD